MSTTLSDDKNKEEKDVVPPPSPQIVRAAESVSGTRLFHHMALHPWPYMIFWPVLFCLLIGFGWTRDDIIEDDVANIWIPQSGAYAADVDYARSLGRANLGATSFAAMAIARDGGNLFAADRLETIRARMEQTERSSVRSIFISLAVVHCRRRRCYDAHFLKTIECTSFFTGRLQWHDLLLGRHLREQRRVPL